MDRATFDNVGATELVQGSIADSRELARLEVALAKDELFQELRAAKSMAILGAASVGLALSAVACLLVAAGLALGPLVMAAAGGVLALASVASGLLASRRIPHTLMASTVNRLETDKESLKERLS